LTHKDQDTKFLTIINENDTVETLKEKVQKAEQEIILKGIRLFMEGKLKVEGRKVKILS
jgi:phosphoribosylglycinamide formyltransferase-1